MRHFTTLFDKNYLAKGLVMLDSLRRHSSKSYVIHVLCLDAETHDVLSEQRYSELIDGIYGVETFRHVPYFSPRAWTEFCWTMASQFTHLIAQQENCESVTYLDADLLFFSDPEPVFTEIGDKCIGVVEHRLIPSKKHLGVNGRFNVAFNYFKNNPTGRECLSTWAAQVRERCDASTCGDQKYLDSWPARYGDECHVIQHIGANVAPWNLANYRLGLLSGPEGQRYPCVDGLPVLWYHYHEYRHGVRLTNYELRPEDIELIYKPYIAAMNAATERIDQSLHLLQR
jgi:hypothetical protein